MHVRSYYDSHPVLDDDDDDDDDWLIDWLMDWLIDWLKVVIYGILFTRAVLTVSCTSWFIVSTLVKLNFLSPITAG